MGSPKGTIRAPSSAAWLCRRAGNHVPIGFGSVSSTVRTASIRSVGACSAGANTMSPRWIASLATASPARFRAQRCPARPWVACRFCAWMPRTRAAIPDGLIVTRSPTATCPDSTVPVTTVPAPCRVKLRSTARRKPASAVRWATCASAAIRAARRLSTPSPVSDDTGMIGASASPLSARASRIWAVTSARRSASARSALVSATSPCDRPSRSRIARCSRVCGMMPSSAATTSRARSIPPAPASIVWISRSCPGTSTKPVTVPPPRSA